MEYGKHIEKTLQIKNEIKNFFMCFSTIFYFYPIK